MRITFLGTPEFALPALRRLHELDVVRLVVSQPDRPAGRRGAVRTPPTVTLARELSLETFQPTDPNSVESCDRIVASRPDVLIVVAYGRLLRKTILELAPAAVVNLHPSLLPAYRGASPIQSAIYDGQVSTGVTLIRMDTGIDTGPIIAERSTVIGPEEIAPTVHDRLAVLGAELLVDTIAEWVGGRLETVPQDDEVATVTRPLERADAELDLRRAAWALYDQWRAFQPWPGSFVKVGGKRIAVPAMDPPTADSRGVGQAEFEASVVSLGCAKGALRIREFKPEGRRSMSARAFVNGYAELLGARWGEPLSAPRALLTGPVR